MIARPRLEISEKWNCSLLRGFGSPIIRTLPARSATAFLHRDNRIVAFTHRHRTPPALRLSSVQSGGPRRFGCSSGRLLARTWKARIDYIYDDSQSDNQADHPDYNSDTTQCCNCKRDLILHEMQLRYTLCTDWIFMQVRDTVEAAITNCRIFIATMKLGNTCIK